MKKKRKLAKQKDQLKAPNAFDRFACWWLAPIGNQQIRLPRLVLGLLTAVYFVDAISDAAFWLGPNGLHSNIQIAGFLNQSGLASEIASTVSPLFLFDSAEVYQAYCIVSVMASLAMAVGYGGRILAVVVWLSMVFWANRLLWLSGMTETLLSLSLFASAIAPSAGPLWKRTTDQTTSRMTGMSLRLLAVQGSLFAIFTTASMLFGAVWWNGTGAVAMAAPASIRSFDLVDWLSIPVVHDVLTHAIILASPAGVFLAWRRSTRITGGCILILWSLTLAILGSHWLYGVGLATSLGTIALCHPIPKTVKKTSII